MRTVHKYKLLPVTHLSVPVGARFLHVGQQGDDLYIWLEVNTAYPLVTKLFKAYATGQEISNMTDNFLATVQMKDGLVFHVYDGGGVING